MSATTDLQLSRAIASESVEELEQAKKRIEHCVKQLTDEQVWWRPDESQNSIANLMLHLAGNLRQWVISGLGGIVDDRNRPLEFSHRDQIPREQLIARLGEVVREAAEVISKTKPEEWLRVRRIQSFEVSGLGALMHTVPHFRGHTQEIIYRTRCALGERYKYFWVPVTVEQGAKKS